MWQVHQCLSIETDMCIGNNNNFKLKNLKHYKTLACYTTCIEVFTIIFITACRSHCHRKRLL